MLEPHPRSTDPLYLLGSPELVISFDRSGDPVLPTALRCGTVSGIFCQGDQWDDDQMETPIDGSHILWSDGLRR